MLEKLAKTQTAIDPLLAKRWSPRAFDAGKDLSAEQITSLLEAARWAPSCFGDQPWYYIVCHQSTNPAAWERAFNCMVPFNQEWVKRAPLILLSICRDHFHHNDEPNHWAQHDTGAASENICLQATAMGLAAHQMAGYDAERAKQAFQIPQGYTCLAMIAVGYPSTPDVLTEELKTKELAERTRVRLEDRFFNGTWGQE